MSSMKMYSQLLSKGVCVVGTVELFFAAFDKAVSILPALTSIFVVRKFVVVR
jgi:hypothetical protein